MKTYFTLFLLSVFMLASAFGQDETNAICPTGQEFAKNAKWGKAIESFKICLSNAEKENDYMKMIEIHSDGLGRCYEQLENYEKAIDNYKKAIDIIKTKSNASSSSLAKIYVSLGFCYTSFGLLDKGEELVLKGMELYKKSKEKYELAGAYAKFSGMCVNIGKNENAIKYGLEAIQKYEEAVEVNLQEQEDIPMKIGVVRFNMGLAYSNLGKLLESEIQISKVIEVAKTKPTWKKTYLIHAYSAQGQNHANWNEDKLAIEYFQKTIDLSEEYEKSNSIVAVLAHYHLGQALARQGNHKEATLSFNKTLKLAPDYLISANSYLSANFHTGITRSYSNINEFEKALEYGNIALKKYEALQSTEDYFYIQLLIELLHINSKLNNFSQAEAFYQTASKLLDNSNYKFDRLYSDLCNSKALYLVKQGKDVEAGIYFDKALTYICSDFSEFPKEEITCTPDALALDAFNVVHAHSNFLAETSNKTIDLERGVRQCSLTIQKVEEINEQRKFANQKSLYYILDELSKSGQKNADKLYKLTGDKKALETVLFFADYRKALDLQKALQASEAPTYANIPEDLLEKRKQLRRDLFSNETLLTEAVESGDSEMISHYRDDIIFNLNRENEKLNEQISKYSPVDNSAAQLQKSANTLEIQNNIGAQELFIEYSTNEEKQELDIFVITKEKGLQLYKSPLNEEIYSKIKSFNKLMRYSNMARNSSREKFIRLSHDLYQQFIAPIEAELIGKNRLIIIGDGMTYYIPFETLLKTDELKSFTDLEYLVKDHEISYHYSATLFTATRNKEFAGDSGIYAFAPVYESSVGTSRGFNTRTIEPDSTLRAIDGDGNYTPLPLSETEVKTIVDLFKAKGEQNVKLALRQDANEANLKNNLEQSYQFMHIAGHSFADLKNSKFSGIACYGKSENTKEDGTLYTGEIYNLNTQADLVTLSSCESGFGKLKKTEGLMGLNRAFIYAGAPNVVFSLWKIYDKVSADLMVDFYKETLDGQTYSAALREAKLNLIKSEATASPHFWSPFLLIGK